jgi:mRNA-degrading endonuclease YafQ of YafQ-DinJ toxin-antitoxin module
MRILRYPRYERSFSRLDPQIQQRARERIAIFKEKPFDSRLGTHPLHGRMKDQWSFSVDARFRILFEFLDEARQVAAFLDIGAHSLYL